MFTLEPTNIGQPTQADRAAMPLLQSHLAILGDYNGNGTVDAADYVVWRKMLDQNVTVGTGADADGNGVVNQSDYNIWRQSFGNKRSSYPPAAAAVAAVPEPGNLSLIVLIYALIRPHRRRRTQHF